MRIKLCRLVWSVGVVGLLSANVSAQAPPTPPPPLNSPEVAGDGRVTFRLRAPGAREVFAAVEGSERQAMVRDDQGVWSSTTAALAPDFYGYSFVVDGVSQTDPSNAVTKPNFIWRASEVHVPGPASLPWEVADVPRGKLHRHFVRSRIVGDWRDFHVYTPPGYDSAKADYPVLYLLHGYSDDASGWTAIGRAHVILDNLIAQGKAQPMLVVMPFGYGAPEILKQGGGMRDPLIRLRNVDNFRKVLLEETIPEVEKTYRVRKGRESRAIAGLSMGGGQALEIGLNGLDHFAWVAGFSSAIAEDLPARFAAADAKGTARLRLLWIGCGKTDFLIEPNRKFHAWLEGRAVKHTFVETPGAHTWMVWRRYLAELTPLLFR